MQNPQNFHYEFVDLSGAEALASRQLLLLGKLPINRDESVEFFLRNGEQVAICDASPAAALNCDNGMFC